MTETTVLHLAEIAATPGPLPERGQALLEELRRLVPFDASWLAVADPVGAGYASLASTGLDQATIDYLSGPKMARDIELTGTNRERPPLSPSDLPYPAEELPTWAECLIPAGFHEALGMALFGPGRRHVGFLGTLSASRTAPADDVRARVGELARIVGRGIDPMRTLLTAARLVQGAVAGVALCAADRTAPLPGLPGDRLLAVGSAVLDVAREVIRDGQPYSSFLWPRSGRHAPDGHARVTVLASTADVPAVLSGMVLLSPAGDLRGLTARELEVLGLVVEGRSNHEIARELVVAPRTVAAHLEHILHKLHAPSRTLAAVRAEREGLYVPPSRRPCRP